MLTGGPGPLLLRGGTVRTLDPARPVAGAVLVEDGTVVALGAEALTRAPRGATSLDLEGGAVLPAFGDGHCHPLWGGVELFGAPVRHATDVDAVAAAVREHAATHPELAWVTGGSFDLALVPDGRFDARWLDRAVPDRPVYLESADHHCAWVNTAALRLAGIDAGTPDPPAGFLPRREDGEPLGTLVEWTAMDLVRRHLPPVRDIEKRAGLAAATGLLAAAGVTWAQEAAIGPADVETYLAVAAAGRLAVRVNLALRAEPGQWHDQLDEFREARDAAADAEGVSVRTVKLFADGVVEAGTAALLAPYTDAPDSTGLPVWSGSELAEAVSAFDADGFQVHIHAIGDAAVRRALDAVQAAEARNGPRDRRPVLAHVQVVDPRDVPRFAALGVVANVEPLWARLDDVMTRLTLPRLGPERAARQYPFASLLRAGATLSMGSDWPVSSMRPLDGLAVAVTRRTEEGEPPDGWLPGERLTAEQALAAYTRGSAYQAFEENLWGTVAAGRRADLVWLEADPLAVDPPGWPALAVRGTWLGGQRTHPG